MLHQGKPVSGYPADRRPPAISDYDLIRPIGQGAYGEVWLARGVTGLFRAVKIVRRDAFGTAEPFEREFRGLKEFAAISLVAANQLVLLHVGQNQEAGFFYYAMELADDIDTGAEIDIEHYSPCTLSALQRKKGRLTTQEAIEIGVELARGLASLHSHGLIHRDIKPANIVFVGGTPKLADIGLVTAAELGQSIIGTEGFIAPEGPGTPAADVYSAGKVLYELNTGLDRKSFPVLPHGANEGVNHRRFLDLNEVVLRACEADASRRYQNAEALLEDLLSLQAGRGLLRKRIARWLSPVLFRLGIALMVFAAAAAGAWLWPKISAPDKADSGEAGITAHSIAVLPFETSTGDGEFANNMHEELTSRLARIRDLRVITRTSVLEYLHPQGPAKARKKQAAANPGEKPVERTLKEIAVGLGADSLLKGTVRREASHLAVHVSLIDARTEKRLWEVTYNEDLSEVFAMQTKLSEKIAAALRAKLTENERRLIARRPTENTAAYYLYLEARALDRKLGFYGQKAYEDVIKLCERAVDQTDGAPDFAEAYAQLSLAHSALYRFSDGDPTPGRMQKAVEALERAVEVTADKGATELPETRLARGVIYYLRDKDWKRALGEFQETEKDLPNDEQVQWWTGNVLRRLGRWDDAIRCFKISSPLNPFAPGGGITAVQSMRYLRRFVPAREYAQKLLLRFGNNRWLNAEFAKCQFEIDGNHAAFLDYLDNKMPSGDNPTKSALAERGYESAYRRGDWAEAERMLSLPELKGIGENPDYLLTPVALHRALVAFLRSQPDSARTHAEQALAIFKNGTWNTRQEPWALMGQARAYALLGKTEEALGCAQAAWSAVKDKDKDRVDEAIMRSRLAEVYLILGRTADALNTLDEMMKLPSDWGPQAVRADPLWARVKDVPKFEEILRSAKSYELSSQ